MLTEYVDCTELKRLIEDKKIKPAALKYYLRQKGIIFTASNAEEFAEQVFTIFLGAREMEEIRDMLLNSGNYEKSLVMNIKYKADTQEDIIDIDELEKAVYRYVEFYGDGGELHERGGVATMIESMVFTKEKLKALGLPEDALADGWWIGFHVTDESVWKKVKDGTYSMFSIEGEAIREEVEGNAK